MFGWTLTIHQVVTIFLQKKLSVSIQRRRFYAVVLPTCTLHHEFIMSGSIVLTHGSTSVLVYRLIYRAKT